jgi:hypothetical protein
LFVTANTLGEIPDEEHGDDEDACHDRDRPAHAADHEQRRLLALATGNLPRLAPGSVTL